MVKNCPSQRDVKHVLSQLSANSYIWEIVTSILLTFFLDKWWLMVLKLFKVSPPTGMIQEEYLRELLTTMGDRFTDEEVDELFREAPIDKKGNFNYVAFTRILKHGAKDKDD